MSTYVEDFTKWTLEALIQVPPETLEYSDLVGLVVELQKQLEVMKWMREGLEK